MKHSFGITETEIVIVFRAKIYKYDFADLQSFTITGKKRGFTMFELYFTNGKIFTYPIIQRDRLIIVLSGIMEKNNYAKTKTDEANTRESTPTI